MSNVESTGRAGNKAASGGTNTKTEGAGHAPSRGKLSFKEIMWATAAGSQVSKPFAELKGLQPGKIAIQPREKLSRSGTGDSGVGPSRQTSGENVALSKQSSTDGDSGTPPDHNTPTKDKETKNGKGNGNGRKKTTTRQSDRDAEEKIPWTQEGNNPGGREQQEQKAKTAKVGLSALSDNWNQGAGELWGLSIATTQKLSENLQSMDIHTDPSGTKRADSPFSQALSTASADLKELSRSHSTVEAEFCATNISRSLWSSASAGQATGEGTAGMVGADLASERVGQRSTLSRPLSDSVLRSTPVETSQLKIPKQEFKPNTPEFVLPQMPQMSQSQSQMQMQTPGPEYYQHGDYPQQQNDFIFQEGPWYPQMGSGAPSIPGNGSYTNHGGEVVYDNGDRNRYSQQHHTRAPMDAIISPTVGGTGHELHTRVDQGYDCVSVTSNWSIDSAPFVPQTHLQHQRPAQPQRPQVLSASSSSGQEQSRGRFDSVRSQLHPASTTGDRTFRLYTEVYRTFMCDNRNCTHSEGDCYGAHYASELRRVPIVHQLSSGLIDFSYYPRPCTAIFPVEGGAGLPLTACADGNQCRYSHTYNETQYHPLTFKTTKCAFFSDNEITHIGICPLDGPRCTMAHKPSELRDEWIVMRDLVYGTDIDPSTVQTLGPALTGAQVSAQTPPLRVGNSLVDNRTPSHSAADASGNNPSYAAVAHAAASLQQPTSSQLQQQQLQLYQQHQQLSVAIRAQQQQSQQQLQQQSDSETTADFDVLVYKTMPCARQKSSKFKMPFRIRKCADRVSCDGYHDQKERRRPPNLYSYCPEPCPAVYDRDNGTWSNPSLCPLGDNCHLSHSLMEVMYHKDKYKTKSCERWAKPGLQCSWGPRCAYQHGDNDLPNAADRYRQGSDSPPSNIHQSGETEMILTNMSVTNGARGQLQRSSGIAWSLGSNTVTGDKLCPNVNTCAPDVMLLTQKLEATQKQLSQLASGYRSLHKRTECPGCDGSATRDQALACGHFFCRECTNSNLRSEKNNARVSCPVCNVDTPLGKILKLTE